MAKKIPSPDKSVLTDLYIDQNLSTRSIAKIYGVSVPTVCIWLKSNDIKIKDHAARNNTTLALNSTRLKIHNSEGAAKLESISWLKDQYIRKMRSLQDIGRETGNASGETTRAYVKKYKLDILRDRYRSFVLYKLAMYYTRNSKITFNKIVKTVKRNWINSNLIIDKVRELGLDVKAPNSYPRKIRNKSQLELNVAEWVSQYYPNMKSNFYLDRNSMTTRNSVDMYIEELSLIIEINGVFYHSIHNGFARNEHIKKKLAAKEQGFDLIYLWEDDIMNNPEIIQSMLLHRFNLSQRIYARKCKLRLLDKDIKKDFLNNNHLQGDVRSTAALGLYYNDILMCCMSLIKINDTLYELNRFCNLLNHSVVGGFSKILNYFRKSNPSIDIISYSHNDWSNGEIYNNNGFTKIRVNPPSYTYYNSRINGIVREHRTAYNKKNIVKKFNLPKEFHEKYTETELIDIVNKTMKTPFIHKIYDCGTTTWIKKAGINPGF